MEKRWINLWKSLRNRCFVTDYGAVPNDSQDDYSAVMSTINAAKNSSGLSIVYFPAGTYNVNSTINLSRTSISTGFSDIVLQGAGSDQTVLQFMVGNTDTCIHVHGVETGSTYAITSDVAKNSTLLSCSDLSTFSANNWIHLCEQEFPYGGDEEGFVGQITQLIAINSGQATMKDEASKEYLAENNLWIQKIYPIMNVGIEKLKIQRMDQSYSTQGANIFFNKVVNCWVKGVESENTTYMHLNIYECSQLEISGNYFHHARSYGELEQILPPEVMGTGYGLCIGYSSTNCLIENNIFRKLRHGMLLSCGPNANVFVYNYSRESEGYSLEFLGDLCLHGRYPYSNLFEHNYVEFIEADETHNLNGPYNAFVRNIVKDHDGAMHKIVLVDADSSNVLGCEALCDETYTPVVISGSTYLSTDLYGIVIDDQPPYNTYETGVIISHSSLAQNWYYFKNYIHLHDISYYYSQRPEFLSTAYTFPSIGPEFTSQNIPAKDRYDSSDKSYIHNPTTTSVKSR